MTDRLTVRLGRWFLHWNPEGRWSKPPNAEGNHDFRGRKVHVTRIKIGA